MFYFGFLSSYLPYLLLIAAPLCYFFYGTVVDPNIDYDDNKTISIASDYKAFSDNSAIHFNSIEQVIAKDASNNIKLKFAKSFRSTCCSPPPLKNIFTGSDIWSRPPPQIIM
jgi:hypothetical protein